ncbi:MAG: ATP-grasp domain-containing protein [Syntrophotaleaceae bacterium]
MKIAVCFNEAPTTVAKGEVIDLLSEQGARHEAEAVLDALKTLKHSIELVPLQEDINDFIAHLKNSGADLVFNICKGFWGDRRREMHLAALLDLLGLTYTGATPYCLGLSQDKARTKDLFSAHRLPTPPYALVRMGGHSPQAKNLGFPLIVKPRFEDASLGITEDSIVYNEKALLKRVRYVHEKYRQDALVEEFIEGRELNVSIFGNGHPEVLPISEIRFDSSLPFPIVSYSGKWVEDSREYDGTRPICPAPLRMREEFLIKDVALRAFKLLDCRDYARVDIRLRNGVPYILEVNAKPDITPEASLARSALSAGMTYPVFIGKLVDFAMKRKPAYA